jgi:endo-1,3(4)-beta-glucanase
LVATNGEFNLGKLNFTYTSPLDYVPPIANAGENVVVIIPETTAILDGALSNDLEGEALTYNWEQIYGPSTISFDDTALVSPSISNLEEGIYKIKLTVSDGTYTANSDVLVLVQQTSNSNPTVNISLPTENQSFAQGSDITLSASASDLDGTISKIEFYDGTIKLGEDTTSPYSYTWINASVGAHQIKAIVTDNDSGEGTSQIVNISVIEVQSCSETSNEAQQGAFSTGFTAVFETVGTNVNITFELLDTNRSGVIAYLWKQTPFGEAQMDNVGGLKFKKTLGGLNSGETITYACKFAFAGGLAVTKYISYEVGSNCGSLSIVDESSDTKIVMFPNPVNNKLFIKSQSEDLIKIEIYSVFGNLVKSVSKNLNEINVEDLSSGLYLTKVYTLKGSISKKLIKN